MFSSSLLVVSLLLPNLLASPVPSHSERAPTLPQCQIGRSEIKIPEEGAFIPPSEQVPFFYCTSAFKEATSRGYTVELVNSQNGKSQVVLSKGRCGKLQKFKSLGGDYDQLVVTEEVFNFITQDVTKNKTVRKIRTSRPAQHKARSWWTDYDEHHYEDLGGSASGSASVDSPFGSASAEGEVSKEKRKAIYIPHLGPLSGYDSEKGEPTPTKRDAIFIPYIEPQNIDTDGAATSKRDALFIPYIEPQNIDTNEAATSKRDIDVPFVGNFGGQGSIDTPFGSLGSKDSAEAGKRSLRSPRVGLFGGHNEVSEQASVDSPFGSATATGQATEGKKRDFTVTVSDSVGGSVDGEASAGASADTPVGSVTIDGSTNDKRSIRDPDLGIMIGGDYTNNGPLAQPLQDVATPTAAVKRASLVWTGPKTTLIGGNYMSEPNVPYEAGAAAQHRRAGFPIPAAAASATVSASGTETIVIGDFTTTITYGGSSGGSAST